MSCYNEDVKWVEQSIESVLNQSYRSIEFIIVLDNPKNLQLREYLLKKSCLDERMILHINEKNIGLARSLNKGIAMASYDYIARMDADDICDHERFARQMDYLLANHLDICGSQVSVIDERDHVIKDLKHSLSDKVIKRELKYFNPMIHPTWLVRKDVFVRLKGYLPFPINEDYDFLIRAAIKGYRIGNIDEVLVKYRSRSTSMTHVRALDGYYTNRYILKKLKNRIPLESCKSFRFSEMENRRFYENLRRVNNEKKLWIKGLKLILYSLLDNRSRRFYFQGLLEKLSGTMSIK